MKKYCVVRSVYGIGGVDGDWDFTSTTRGDLMDGVKVFTATKAKERGALGDKITEWLRASPSKHLVDVKVTQSSDEEFHCLTVTILYTAEED